MARALARAFSTHHTQSTRQQRTSTRLDHDVVHGLRHAGKAVELLALLWRDVRLQVVQIIRRSRAARNLDHYERERHSLETTWGHRDGGGQTVSIQYMLVLPE